MEENNSDDDNLNDLSGKSEDDIIEQCERVLKNISESEDKNRQESQELGRSKRMREKSEGSSEDGFVTVIRRKPKRLIRSESITSKNDNCSNPVEINVEEKYDVIVTDEENVTVMEFDEINEELNKQDRTRSPIIGSAPQKARKINSNKNLKETLATISSQQHRITLKEKPYKPILNLNLKLVEIIEKVYCISCGQK
ncbi:hypothetical protein HF086_015409 [Spodoptera exigua]|uniref:Uncharacterized protein n=1 Tax=Spodoptera exigua TaxID=7107 RepID=A0A922MWJ6_SPOEX|nr:hypothetical protein HF086_015409 [Spodoptera exigua]